MLPTVPVLIMVEYGARISVLNEALLDFALVTLMTYVWVVDPFWAVTMVVMAVVAPSAKAIDPDAVPDVTAMPFTFTVALTSCVTGVTVTDAVAFTTDVV